MNIHELKCLPQYYNKVIDGTKTFEVRKYDRDFFPGDIIHLKEFSGDVYSGRSCVLEITYMLKDFEALVPGYVVLSVRLLK